MSTQLPAPVVASYRLALPSGLWRSVMTPLNAALRAVVPQQARAQRDRTLLDREYTIMAMTPEGMPLTLTFRGPELTVVLGDTTRPDADDARDIIDPTEPYIDINIADLPERDAA
jgi:hypothetical protein